MTLHIELKRTSKMIEESTLEIFVNIIQFMATLLVASDYYLNRKELKKLHKHYTNMYNIVIQKNAEKVSELVALNKNTKIFNWLKLIIGLMVIFSILIIIGTHSVDLNNIYIIISMLLIMFISSFYMMKSFVKLTEVQVEKSGYWLNRISQKIIFRAKKNSLVGLGVFLFSISFVLNILIILKLNNTILMYIIIGLIFMVVLNIGILIDAYNKYRQKD